MVKIKDINKNIIIFLIIIIIILFIKTLENVLYNLYKNDMTFTEAVLIAAVLSLKAIINGIIRENCR